ncbi:unnamed protein product [Echinostoma caproni]|uniref:DUF4433 domain-containing protein n=1 Tax=Echinostoma caproni TaxID=27848 RepID=A0A183AYN7_9TREM|nr:unnamed protein product [Echinostoma caproni]
MTLVSLGSGDRVEVTEAFTIADFPMRVVETIGEPATRWPHLKDLRFEEADSAEVDLLVGCDVPEAQWVLDQRLGSRKEPYATRNVFWWTSFGPPQSANHEPLSINFTTTTTAGDDTIEQTLHRIYDNEVNDFSDRKVGPSIEHNQASAIVEMGRRCQPNRFEVPLSWRI